MAKTVFEKAFLQKDINAILVLSLEKLNQSIDDLLWRQAMEHGLSPLQIRLLLIIRHKAEIFTASQLAAELNVAKATISVALKPLIEKKLILKRKSATDNRASALKLTEWGEQIAHIAGFYFEPLYQLIVPIDKSEKELMLKNISGILGKLNALKK
ncbi:MarR family transcriptional regulator [Taibaiella lutea]|uniref:MarR family transcriptional regulator n=1 Tax=Taibaiella lutea TaxID=2608001 RepID=A0A5M6CPT4_9BACT|nr:helix-turn-helix domain-containing protein [Taibaiella lutea]KAA5537174.1 MarR family transcriptional regulator [Taibaiella lutea]